MTTRERFNGVFRWEKPDWVPNMEFGYWDDHFKLWPMFADNGIKTNAEADDFFSFDRIAVIGGRIWTNPPYENTVVEDRGTHKGIMNADGLLAEVPKDGHDTIPHYIKSSIQTPDDPAKIISTLF